MNTVERVAQAICSQWVADNYGWEGDIQKDFVEESWTSHKDEAKAALSALAEGLEWKPSLKDGAPDSLFLNGMKIGRVYRTKDQVGTPPEGYWHGELFNATNQAYVGPDAARTSVEELFRKWLIGD